MSYGWGDGGGGPTREDTERQRRLSLGVAGLPNAKIESLHNSVRTIKANYEKNAAELQRKPVWNGELYFEYHRGTLSSVPEVKMNNRKGEFALLNAELFSVMGNALFGMDYPQETLEKDWKLLLVNQFHDILPGSSIGDVYQDSAKQFETIFQDTADMVDGVIDGIAKQVQSNGGWLVFNPNSFTINGTVCVDGKTYIAKEIPAFGYKVIESVKDISSSVKVGKFSIENGRRRRYTEENERSASE
jgi:alpha-mannosidase